MSIKDASAALRKGLSFGASFPAVGLANRVADGVQMRTMTQDVISDALYLGKGALQVTGRNEYDPKPKPSGGNRRQRRAAAAQDASPGDTVEMSPRNPRIVRRKTAKPHIPAGGPT